MYNNTVFSTELIRKSVLGKPTDLHLQISYFYENPADIEGDFDFGDEAENQAYLNRFKSGELECVGITVKVFVGGVVGNDYLGMTHVRASYFADDIREAIKEHTMVENAVADLEQQIKELASVCGFLIKNREQE